MNTNSWHLSKSVPISFILAILAQTVALVWYVSSLDNNIKNNQRELIRHETRIEALEKIVQTQAVTLGRMDENIKAIRHSVEKMANTDTKN
jgi:septal ring factor EnvC (AmiA/AmiB activator)